MTSHSPSIWSEELQQQTRDAIEQLRVTADGRLRFKHATLGYAYATYDDLCNNRLVLYSDRGGDTHHFPLINNLLQAGWVLD